MTSQSTLNRTYSFLLFSRELLTIETRLKAFLRDLLVQGECRKIE